MLTKDMERAYRSTMIWWGVYVNSTVKRWLPLVLGILVDQGRQHLPDHPTHEIHSIHEQENTRCNLCLTSTKWKPPMQGSTTVSTLAILETPMPSVYPIVEQTLINFMPFSKDLKFITCLTMTTQVLFTVLRSLLTLKSLMTMNNIKPPSES